MYRKGYFKALLDVMNLLIRQEQSLKTYKINNVEHIIKLMQYCIDNVEDMIEQGDKIDVLYLCSKEQKCVIVGQDLSRISALMAYIVLSMLGCQAVIKIGDTLCNPYTSFFKEVHINDIWYTPMFVVNEGYLKGV